MKTIRIVSQLAALLLIAPATHAQVVGPGYSGINRITLPGLSDTILSTPFARPDAAAGMALSFTGNVITFQGTPGWTANQFVTGGAVTDSFYLLIGSGPKEGASFTVTANDTASVTVNLDGDTLTGLTAGDKLSIVPYWTLSTLFPGGAGVHVSPSAGNRQTEVMFPNFSATGINSSTGRIFYLWNGNWREVGQGAAIRDNEIVYPDSYFTVRHNIGTATEFVSNGQVVPGKLVNWLGVNTAGKRDNYVGLQRPIAMTLAASGLISSGAFSASPSPGNRADELLVFDNSIARQNKAASAIYYYWNGAWRKVGTGSTNFDNAPVFTPGAGFVIRKNASPTAPTWVNSANY